MLVQPAEQWRSIIESSSPNPMGKVEYIAKNSVRILRSHGFLRELFREKERQILKLRWNAE